MSALNAVLSVEAIYLLERERTITGGAEQPKLGRRQVEAKAEGEPMRLRGRPRKYADSPWKLAGISRATWYRRRETGGTASRSSEGPASAMRAFGRRRRGFCQLFTAPKFPVPHMGDSLFPAPRVKQCELAAL
jgi:hypothetical protein